MKSFIISAMALVAVSSPAMAQDAPPVGGFHIEGVVGYDHTRGKVSYTDTAFPEDNFSESDSTDGAVFGVNAGYDVAFGNSATLGVEGGFEWSDNERCEEIFGGDEGCVSLKRNLYLGVKGSTAFTPYTSLTTGIGYVNGKAAITYVDPAFPADNFSVSDNRDGYRLSIGLEQRFGANFFGKVDYRYSDYKNYDYSDGTETYSLGFNRHQVVAGLGVRF